MLGLGLALPKNHDKVEYCFPQTLTTCPVLPDCLATLAAGSARASADAPRLGFTSCAGSILGGSGLLFLARARWPTTCDWPLLVMRTSFEQFPHLYVTPCKGLGHELAQCPHPQLKQSPRISLLSCSKIMLLSGLTFVLV